MGIALKVFIYLLTLGAGFAIQSLTRLSPWLNIGLSYLIILLIPPGWSLGLVAGLWIACAFFTFNPDLDRLELLKAFSWFKVFFVSLWTFSGFILTLFLIWKLKVSGYLLDSQREFLAWMFLVLIEVCQYRVVARISPVLHRIPLGYGAAFFDFLMLLYWLYPMGVPIMALALVTLIIINPLLLVFVDLPVGSGGDPYLRRNG